MSRIEKILRAMIDGTSYGEEPQSRIEAILLAIKNNTQYLHLPYSRIEEILLAIKNGTSYGKEPMSRIEEILLAKLNGVEYTKLPQSRIEELLIEWLIATAYKELEGVPPLIFKSDGSALKNYRFYGAAWGVGDYDEESGKYVIPVTIAGKNKFDGTLFSGYYTDSTMTSIGGASGNYKSFKLLLSAGTYTFSCSVPVLIIRYITSDIYRSNPIGSKYTQDYTFTLANDSYVSLAFRNESNTAWDDSTTIQVELSQSATEYEQYHKPIVSTISLDTSLTEGESVSMEDTGVYISTIDGTNILTVGTKVQPSKVYLKYEGG